MQLLRPHAKDNPSSAPPPHIEKQCIIRKSSWESSILVCGQ